MKRTVLSHRVLAALVGVAVLGVARVAAADPTSCTQDSDCTKGFTCQVTGASACPGYACLLMPGDDAGVCPPQPACDPTVIMGCAPGPCTTDSDCATGMVCYAESFSNCTSTSPACPPGADCAEPAFDAGGCSTNTTRSCVPRYVPPCKVDSDCGEGFTCTPDTAINCSGGGAVGSGGSTGSGGTVGSGGGAEPVGTPAAPDAGVPVDTCTTTTLSTSSCQAKTIACTTASDCPGSWTCVAQAQPVAECAGVASIDGSIIPCDLPPPAPAHSFCEPPFADLGYSTGGRSASFGSGEAVPTASNGGTDGTVTGGGAAPSPVGSRGGCAVTSPGGSRTGALPLLAFLGLAALGRRRRQST
jgi:MYXO-CTERM domain-containing protein